MYIAYQSLPFRVERVSPSLNKNKAIEPDLFEYFIYIHDCKMR